MYEIKLPESLIDKIRDRALYIACDQPLAALKWYDAVFAAIERLNTLPNRCPEAPESAFFNFTVRHLLLDDYRILFRVSGNTVEILDVKGGRESKPAW